MSARQPTSPGPQYSDILQLAHQLRMDLNAAQAKLVTICSFLAQQPDDRRVHEHTCRHDGLAFATDDRLREHLANVHGEPKQ